MAIEQPHTIKRADPLLPMFDKKKIAASIILLRRKIKKDGGTEYETETKEESKAPRDKLKDNKQARDRVNAALTK